jgi:hypothetical protein
VRFTRRFEEGFARGYVLDVGEKFFLLALLGEGMGWNGFSCFRISDVRNLTVDPYAAFAEAALKKLGEKIPKKPKVSLVSTEEILNSADRLFPLITIHREHFDPDVCWIGQVYRIEDGEVCFWEIGPDAKWDRKPTFYKLREITAIEFGGSYEAALYLVGGNSERPE